MSSSVTFTAGRVTSIALVAFDGSFGLGDHIQLAPDAFVLPISSILNSPMLMTCWPFLHRFHHHRAVQMVDGSLIEDFLAIIFLDKARGAWPLRKPGMLIFCFRA